MGIAQSSTMTELISGIQPFFDFMHILWSALPAVFRWLFAIVFAAAVGFALVRNIAA